MTLLSHARRRTVGAVAAAALALTATLAPIGAATATPQPVGPTQAAANGRPVDVMSRNLYLGADLMPVIGALAAAATNPNGVPVAASQTWAAVQATDPEERMAAIADEIAAARPAVVGLQEVTTWVTYDPTFTPTVRYDFLQLLLDELADRGMVYHEVAGATSTNFGSPPIPLVPTATEVAVEMSDRDVIIRRDDVSVDNAHHGNFTNKLTFPLPTGPLPVDRGWGSVDVSTNHSEFRFVNSHLEAFGFTGVDAEELRVGQVGELLAAQAALDAEKPLPAVYVGDYNSDAPDAAAYSMLVDAVGSDAWSITNPQDPGLTCCFDAAVTDPDNPLTSRIDLVVVEPGIQPIDAEVVGEEVTDMTESGLWPSDHAGVLARLVVAGQRGGPRG